MRAPPLMTDPTDSLPETEAIPVTTRPLLFLWASGGVVLLIAQALYRLSGIAYEALSSGAMSDMQWAICGVWTLSNCYMEGYKGFHKKFVPRVVARAHYLAHNPFQPATLIAPLFSMAFFHSDRRGKIGAWVVTVAVMLAIFVVRGLPQPWRGIVDAGVVAGLGIGTASLLYAMARRMSGARPEGDPQLPESR